MVFPATRVDIYSRSEDENHTQGCRELEKETGERRAKTYSGYTRIAGRKPFLGYDEWLRYWVGMKSGHGLWGNVFDTAAEGSSR